MALPQNDPVILRLFCWLTEIFSVSQQKKDAASP